MCGQMCILYISLSKSEMASEISYCETDTESTENDTEQSPCSRVHAMDRGLSGHCCFNPLSITDEAFSPFSTAAAITQTAVSV